MIQRRDSLDYETYMGAGKLQEVIEVAQELHADILIIGNLLKPAQIYNIETRIREAKLSLQVWDKVDLILKIFALHAHTPEAKLQIELAAIRHM